MTTETKTDLLDDTPKPCPFDRGESRAKRIEKGREALPKGGLLVRSATADGTYVNFEHDPRIVRVTDPKVVFTSYREEKAAHEKAIASRRAKGEQVSENDANAFRDKYDAKVHWAFAHPEKYEIMFYSGFAYGWLRVDVSANYPLIPQDHENAPTPVAKLTERDNDAPSSRGAKKSASAKVGVNPRTGYKSGSVGDVAGAAYLEAGGSKEKAVALVEKAFRTRWDSIGHEYTDKDAVGQARLWVRILRDKFPEIYAELKEGVKTPAKKAAEKKVAKQEKTKTQKKGKK